MAVFGALGAAATVFGVGLVVAPSLVYAGPVERATRGLASDVVGISLVVALAVVLFAIVAARPSARATESSEREFAERFRPPETDTEETAIAAGAVDAEIQAAVRSGGDALGTVRARLATAAAETYAGAVGVSEQRARAAVEAGEWTDDAVAAAFLGGVSPSVHQWLWLWLAPERERRRRIERTIAAIERLQADR